MEAANAAHVLAGASPTAPVVADSHAVCLSQVLWLRLFAFPPTAASQDHLCKPT